MNERLKTTLRWLVVIALYAGFCFVALTAYLIGTNVHGEHSSLGVLISILTGGLLCYLFLRWWKRN